MMHSFYISSCALCLSQALSVAEGGETFVLAGGDYGELVLNPSVSSQVDFAKGLTFVSADSSNPAEFDALFFSEAHNVRLDGVVIDYEAKSSDPIHLHASKIVNSDNVTIVNSVWDGDLAGNGGMFPGYATGQALKVIGGTNFTFENNELYDYWRGLAFDRVDGLSISGNDIHSMSMDGMILHNVSDVDIIDNHIHDFIIPPGNGHLDFIQFYTTVGGTGSENVTISGNYLNSGEGQFTQSIFIANEAVGKGFDAFHTNITVSENLIHNAHTHGITIGETNGVKVDSNTLIQNADSAMGSGSVYTPRILVVERSSGVEITNNITHGILGDLPSSWTVDNNLEIQRTDPSSEDYIGQNFENGFVGASATLSDLQIIPGSLADTLGVGVSEVPSLSTSVDASFEATGDQAVTVPAILEEPIIFEEPAVIGLSPNEPVVMEEPGLTEEGPDEPDFAPEPGLIEEASDEPVFAPEPGLTEEVPDEPVFAPEPGLIEEASEFIPDMGEQTAPEDLEVVLPENSDNNEPNVEIKSDEDSGGFFQLILEALKSIFSIFSGGKDEDEQKVAATEQSTNENDFQLFDLINDTGPIEDSALQMNGEDEISELEAA